MINFIPSKYEEIIYINLCPQVFLPINITKCHWYLTVVCASKGEIQVLDSFGEKMTNWQDLRYTVQHNIYDVRILL